MNDEKIKDYFSKDDIISNNANLIFDKFISNIQDESINNKNNYSMKKDSNIISFEKKKKQSQLYIFRNLLTIAASFVIVFVGLNSYAHTKGYDNIFFLVKDLTSFITEKNAEDIFYDKDIIISYKYFQITDNIEMQINEFQVKDNKAKLYLLVKELEDNTNTPFNYKIFDETNNILYDAPSQKGKSEKIYTEILNLSNYVDSIQKLKLEVYNKDNKLLKTVTIDLEEKVIEAKTESIELKKISQIELIKFLKEKTIECYSESELLDKEIIILKIYDIYYSDSRFIVKYLFIRPSQEDFENDIVENTDIYINTVEFYVNNLGEYKIIKIDKPEIL